VYTCFAWGEKAPRGLIRKKTFSKQQAWKKRPRQTQKKQFPNDMEDDRHPEIAK